MCYGWCILSCYHWSFFPRSDVIISIWFNLKCQHSYEPLLSKLANDMFCSNWLGLPKICFGSAWTPCHCEISILFDRINIPLVFLLLYNYGDRWKSYFHFYLNFYLPVRVVAFINECMILLFLLLKVFLICHSAFWTCTRWNVGLQKISQLCLVVLGET